MVETPLGRPGYGAEVIDTPRYIFDQYLWSVKINVTLDSATVDAGASTTTKLRPGLTLGKLTATNLYRQYDNSASDGTEVARAILLVETNMLDDAGSAEDTAAPVLIAGGLVDEDRLIGWDAAAKVDMTLLILKEDYYG